MSVTAHGVVRRDWRPPMKSEVPQTKLAARARSAASKAGSPPGCGATAVTDGGGPAVATGPAARSRYHARPLAHAGCSCGRVSASSPLPADDRRRRPLGSAGGRRAAAHARPEPAQHGDERAGHRAVRLADEGGLRGARPRSAGAGRRSRRQRAGGSAVAARPGAVCRLGRGLGAPRLLRHRHVGPQAHAARAGARAHRAPRLSRRGRRHASCRCN